MSVQKHGREEMYFLCGGRAFAWGVIIKKKWLFLHFSRKHRRSLLRVNPPHVNVLRKQRMKLLPPLPLTFCSDGRFLFWECISIVEIHSFLNVERSFERFCTCVTLVQCTEFPNFAVSPRQFGIIGDYSRRVTNETSKTESHLLCVS